MALRVRYGTGLAFRTEEQGGSILIPDFFFGDTLQRLFDFLYPGSYPLGFSLDPFDVMARKPRWPGAAGGQAGGTLGTYQTGILLPVDATYEACFFYEMLVGYSGSTNSWDGGTVVVEILKNGIVILTYTFTATPGSGTDMTLRLPSQASLHEIPGSPTGSAGITPGTFIQFSGVAGDFITTRITNNLTITEISPDPTRPTGFRQTFLVFQVLQLYENTTPPPPIVLATNAQLSGASTHDIAVLTDGVFPRGGTITFRLYDASDPTCAGAPIFTYVFTINGATGDYPSTPFVLSVFGEYHWIATYSGDTWNGSRVTLCSDLDEIIDYIAGHFFPMVTLIGAT